MLFSRTPKAVLALAGSCHSGSGIQSFGFQPPGRVATAPHQQLPQHNHGLRCRLQCREISTFLISGYCLFFLLLLHIYVPSPFCSSFQYLCNQFSRGSCFPGWTLTNTITSPCGSLFSTEAILVNARGGCIDMISTWNR